MLNKAILMGRLTRDPELRHTQSNMAVCSFRLAIDRDRKGPNGERQTDFIDCVAWGRQAEFVAQWFAKGVMAIVIGRIQSRQWQGQNRGPLQRNILWRDKESTRREFGMYRWARCIQAAGDSAAPTRGASVRPPARRHRVRGRAAV